MARYENILQAIGHTPLVRLRRIGADVASLIYAKVESLNPGGSVKDRVGVVPGTPLLTAWANSGKSGRELALRLMASGRHALSRWR